MCQLFVRMSLVLMRNTRNVSISDKKWNRLFYDATQCLCKSSMSSVNTFKFSWLTPLWWGCPAPTGSACRSRRRPLWRTRRCCRWSPPSSRTRHSRLPEVDSLIAIFPVYSLAFCPALQQPMPVLASGSGQQESPRSQQVRSSGHRRWSEAGQSPHTWPGGQRLLGGAIL